MELTHFGYDASIFMNYIYKHLLTVEGKQMFIFLGSCLKVWKPARQTDVTAKIIKAASWPIFQY